MKELNTPFYLTGGTALSRHYYNHRYSDDLDLFVNKDSRYDHYIDVLSAGLSECESKGDFKIDYSRRRKTKDYTQMYLLKEYYEETVALKIDLVNDVSRHYGEIESGIFFNRIDSWRNILSNKISAVFRYEAKDFTDIRIIAKNERFNWQDIIEEAKTKETGVDPVVIYEILKSFPADVLDSVKWVAGIDKDVFVSELSAIAEDMLRGVDNSLCIG